MNYELTCKLADELCSGLMHNYEYMAERAASQEDWKLTDRLKRASDLVYEACKILEKEV